MYKYINREILYPWYQKYDLKNTSNNLVETLRTNINLNTKVYISDD